MSFLFRSKRAASELQVLDGLYGSREDECQFQVSLACSGIRKVDVTRSLHGMKQLQSTVGVLKYLDAHYLLSSRHEPQD